jgi:3-phenylpropionate/trans-cinnamate dioxygenase ferredoxin subunit
MEFFDVVKTNEIPRGTMKSFTISGMEILVVNYEGKYYAIANRCTHMKGDLSKGRLEGKIVTCPRHGSQFDVTTGTSLRGPKIGFLNLKTKNEPTYEIKIEGDRIKVGI